MLHVCFTLCLPSCTTNFVPVSMLCFENDYTRDEHGKFSTFFYKKMFYVYLKSPFPLKIDRFLMFSEANRVPRKGSPRATSGSGTVGLSTPVIDNVIKLYTKTQLSLIEAEVPFSLNNFISSKATCLMLPISK